MDIIDTTAATAGSSKTVSKRRAVTIEELPEEEDPQRRVLTSKSEAIMMPESEFLSLPNGGRMEEPNKKTQPPGPSERKTKVSQQGNPTKRKLWDIPVPPPEHQWIRNPQLPPELNEIIAAQWEYNWPQFAPEKEDYRHPFAHEIFGPRESIARMHDRPKKKKDNEQKFSLPTIDESVEAIEKLKRQYQPHKTEDKHRQENSLRDEEAHLAKLRQDWHDKFQDILQGVPEKLPPLRAVNHEINLVEPNKKHMYYLPRCPATVRKEFQEKLNRYVNAKWWVPATGTQALPLMCIPKKDGHIRMVIDARQRNENTVKDVTPLPDQEVIREDVARGKFRSKIDLADAYEQVRIEPKDVHKTLFATIMGTYHSNVVQQGDCNMPTTFQRLMTSIFRDVIGLYIHVYLDDIFIYSDSIEEHEGHLKTVFEQL